MTCICTARGERNSNRDFKGLVLALSLIVLVLQPNIARAQIKIVEQPKSADITTGARIVFNVVAESQYPLGYQWKLNGIILPGKTNESFLLPNVQPTNCGSYSVVVYVLPGKKNPTASLDSDVADLTLSDLEFLPFKDDMADAGSLGNATQGVGRGDNRKATLEKNEPKPDGITGGASVWLRWKPGLAGIGTISTAGSGFDTLLQIYSYDSKNGFVPVGGDDDSGGFGTSQVQFNMASAEEYFIQVDGVYGQMGNLVLSWNAERTDDRLARIITQPKRQLVLPGADVTLFIEVQFNGTPAYQWFQDGIPVRGATSPTLRINNIDENGVGIYQCRVVVTGKNPRVIFSDPAAVQIHVSEIGLGDPNAFAEDKFQVAADPAAGKQDAPASGFTGTQIFSTHAGTKEAGEPNHCDEAGGSSYWLTYVPALDGSLKIDTAGSDFNTILAVYTWPGTGGFDTLDAVACSSTNNGVGGEAVVFFAKNGTTYFVVVDGVGGATGKAHINYSLVSPPTLGIQPASRTVASNAAVVLTVAAAGSPVLGYQWRFNGLDISGANAATYMITGFKSSNQGNYSVMVSNPGGNAATSNALLILDNPLRFTNAAFGLPGFSAKLLCKANTNYVFLASSNLVDWLPLKTNNSPVGIIDFLDATASKTGNRFYRAQSR